MAVQSRGRSQQTAASSRLAAKQTNPTQSHHDQHHHQQHLSNTIPSDDDGPPAKRRKLSIRPRSSPHKQTTLDRFTISHQPSSAPIKPPLKVVAQPHSSLLETVNGVQHALDLRDDDLSSSTPGLATPKSASRVSKRTPQPGDAAADKRTLRSQDDGPRLKSELAIYFPNYEDVIFDVPKEEEFITVETALYVVDDAAKQELSTSPNVRKGGGKSSAKANPPPLSSSSGLRNGSVNGMQHPSTPQRSNSNQFNGSPSLNLDLISRTIPETSEDPLTDDYYLKSHKRAERKEKQLRNIEKERAMHEKVQLDRLLDGLQGHDWLKVLGITGITDGEAKKFEPKRDYFIAEVQALVDKFKEWKEQEKQQRLDREAAQAARDEEEDEVADSDDEDISVSPPSSDLNASAARQLQQETVSALKAKHLTSQQLPNNISKGVKGHASSTSTPKLAVPTYVPPPPEVPITSFYAKRHLRDAALGKARHGRNVTAFGQVIPEMGEREFELPEDYVTEGVMSANAREKRRRKRASVADATAGAEGGGG
jgi:hypothetical protein